MPEPKEIYWGEHKPGMDCPCKPRRGGSITNGRATVFIMHKRIEEEILGEERDAMIKQMNLAVFGQTEVTYEG